MFKRNETASNKSLKGRGTSRCAIPSKTSNSSSLSSHHNSSSVLGAANRFPYSSTPAVSPSIHKGEIGVPFQSVGNENFKKPLISADKNQTELSKPGFNMSQQFSGYVSPTISPIRRATNNSGAFYIQSQARSYNTNNVSYERGAISGGVDSAGALRPRLSSSVMSIDDKYQTTNMPLFPFPNVQTYKQVSKGEVLFNSLRILTLARSFRIANEKLENEKNNHDQSAATKINNKKKDVKLPESGFQFTVDMFKNVNSLASLHVLHLLFESYDPKETEVVFRDYWPVYEKKMEGLFRRAASHWLIKIIETHSEFFPLVKLEAVRGLLVNPGGERFIQLLDAFAQLILFRLTNIKLSDLTKGVMKKPKFVDDSEIINRQLLVLNKASQKQKAETVQVRQQMLKDSMEVKKRMRILNQQKEIHVIETSEKEKSVNRILNLVKDSFTMSDENKPDPCCDELKSNLKQINEKIYYLNAEVDSELRNTALQATKVSQALGTSHKNFKRLWFILGMERNKSFLLDGSKLFFSNRNDKELPTIKDFTKTINTLSEQILSDANLNAALPSAILEKHKSAEFKLQCLKIIPQHNMVSDNRKDLLELKNDFEDRYNKLEAEMVDANWQELSKVNETFTSGKVFHITPPKCYDFKRKTGYTPALANFLPGSNVDEPDSTSYRNVSCVASYRNITTKQLNVSNIGNRNLRFEQKQVTHHMSSCLGSPISRFQSVAERSAIPKVRINLADNVSSPTIPKITTLMELPVISISVEDVQIDEIEEGNVSIDIESTDLDVSDRSCSTTPNGLNLSTQARIARIMGSLNTESPLISTASPAKSMEIEDNYRESVVGMRRQSGESGILKRISMSSTQANNSLLLNRSLLEDWNDEKGIMDISYALDQDESDSDS